MNVLTDLPDFTLHDAELDRRLVLRVTGELDLFTGPDLRRHALARVSELEPEEVVLDLTDCPFVDSAGCAALLAISSGVRARGGRVVLVNRHAGPGRLFATMGLGDLIRVVGTLDEALT